MKVAVSEFGTQMDEFGSRIKDLKDLPQMKTDLQDLARRAQTFNEDFGKALDERIGPLLSLMTGTNTQLNTLSATALDMGRSVSQAIAILVLINDHIKGHPQHETLQPETD
jgi:hypothetical protein